MAKLIDKIEVEETTVKKKEIFLYDDGSRIVRSTPNILHNDTDINDGCFLRTKCEGCDNTISVEMPLAIDWDDKDCGYLPYCLECVLEDPDKDFAWRQLLYPKNTVRLTIPATKKPIDGL